MEIYFKESIGSEGRGYFDMSGLIRDIVQNHVGEIICTFAAKMDKLRGLFLETAETNNYEDWRLGQYNEYITETGKDSNTETLCFMPIFFNSREWKDVPFIIMAGKGMNEKRVEIKANLTDFGISKIHTLFSNRYDGEMFFKFITSKAIKRVSLIINYSPHNMIYLEAEDVDKVKECFVLYPEDEILLFMKEEFGPYTDHEIVFKHFSENQEFPSVSIDEVSALWKIFNPEEYKTIPIFKYLKGSDVPEEVQPLFDKYFEGRNKM